jgi:hypothetical protein
VEDMFNLLERIAQSLKKSIKNLVVFLQGSTQKTNNNYSEHAKPFKVSPLHDAPFLLFPGGDFWKGWYSVPLGTYTIATYCLI